jgi:hypothetical protein
MFHNLKASYLQLMANLFKGDFDSSHSRIFRDFFHYDFPWMDDYPLLKCSIQNFGQRFQVLSTCCN